MIFWRSMLLITVGVVVNLTADIFLKKSANGSNLFFFSGLALTACVAIPTALAYRIATFGRVVIVWQSISVVAFIATAKLLFKERFGIREVIALVLVGSAMLILSKSGN